MRVTMTAATTTVDPKTRRAFSSMCLDDLARQLNEREFPVTFAHRELSIAGKTIPGTATGGHALTVDAELAPPFMTAAELEAALPTLAAGLAGRTLRTGDVYGVALVELVQLTSVAVLPLTAAAVPHCGCESRTMHYPAPLPRLIHKSTDGGGVRTFRRAGVNDFGVTTYTEVHRHEAR